MEKTQVPEDTSHSITPGSGEKEPLYVYLGREKNPENTVILRDVDGRLEEYLKLRGFLTTPSAKKTAPREQVDAKLRQVHHHNVKTLLKLYRQLRSIYRLTCENFLDRLRIESSKPFTELEDAIKNGSEVFSGNITGMLFDRIVAELDLFSAADERHFQKVWMPEVSAARKLEFALYSVEYALRILRANNPSHYEFIAFVFIDGDHRPTVRQTMTHFDFLSATSYYKHLNDATAMLSALIFAHVDNKAELNSIIAWLASVYDNSGRDHAAFKQ